jgi:hypothetical protein
MTKTPHRTPGTGLSSRRTARVQLPALALVAVMILAWVPCLACESPSHANGSPGLASPASCHGVGEAVGSRCGPAIRDASPAVPSLAVTPVAAAVPHVSSPLLRALPDAAVSAQISLAPLESRPLYLLHVSLLA